MLRRSGMLVVLLGVLCLTAFAQNQTCGSLETIRNGSCDMNNNREECDYDGGDCCQCSCKSSDDYTCGQNGFSCEDPEQHEAIYDCKEEPDIETCSNSIGNFSVHDEEDAMDLASVIFCSGGSFNVEWHGSVAIEDTLYVPSGTTVNIIGHVDDAVIDGNGSVRLFTVSGGTLSLENILLKGGKSVIGGAITASNGSTLEFVDTTFENNDADVYGGALYMEGGSSVVWDGKVRFSGNKGTSYGGALYLSDSSKAEWSGRTWFSNNSATLGGGGMYIGGNSNASWDAVTKFENNSAFGEADPGITTGAGSGAALYVDDSARVSWESPTYFSNNSAQGNGGGIYIQRASYVSWTGMTTFFNNSASAEGGALYIYNGYNEGSSSSVFVNGTTNFGNNTCSGSGGGMAVTAASTIKFGTSNVNFIGNSAGVAGGGLFVSGLGLGPHFRYLTFISNMAQVGGAVYSTGCGTAITEDDDGEPVENPSIFEFCAFYDNHAAATGGAMDSGAGLDIINFTHFERNSAEVGGALRLAGTTKLTNCTFIDNKSSENEGPAISNIGFISELENASFIDNTYNCDDGMYLHYNITPKYDDELYEIVCQGCGEETCVDSCEVDGQIPDCLNELPHSNSTGGGMTLQRLLIHKGYWRATENSTIILECYNMDACLGGVTDSEGYCEDGYEGPYCSICKTRHTESLGFTCTACSENEKGFAIMFVFIGMLFLLGFGGLLYLVWPVDSSEVGVGNANSSRIKNSLQGLWHFLVKRSQSFKIIIVVWQIVTQFASVANVIYPNVYQDLLDGIDIMNFDWIISTGCIIEVDFHARLMMSTLAPICVLAVLGVTYIIARVVNKKKEARERVDQKHLTAVLLVMFLVYSWVSSILFQMFACEDLDDKKNYLRADYRIECDSPTHRKLQVYAALMIVLYTVGIPAFYAWLLFKNREILSRGDGGGPEGGNANVTGEKEMDRPITEGKGSDSRENNPSTKAISSLWETYKPRRYFYELVECGRRILLAGVVVFIYPNTAPQVAIALMMAAFFMVLNEVADPYDSPWDAWLSRTGHAIVFTSMYLALLLKADVSDENMDSQKVYETILVVSHAGMGVIVVIEAMVAVFQKYREHKKEASPDSSVDQAGRFSLRQVFPAPTACPPDYSKTTEFVAEPEPDDEEEGPSRSMSSLELVPMSSSGSGSGKKSARSGRKAKEEDYPMRSRALPSYKSHVSRAKSSASHTSWKSSGKSWISSDKSWKSSDKSWKSSGREPLGSPPPYNPQDDADTSDGATNGRRMPHFG